MKYRAGEFFRPTPGTAHLPRAHTVPHIEDDNDGWHVVIPSIGYRSERGYTEDEAARRLKEKVESLD